MENPLFQAVSFVAFLCASADGHSFSASVIFQAFPSLSPCLPRLGTEAAAQPLQFSAVCTSVSSDLNHVLNCPLPGNLFEYSVVEWRRVGAWGWAKDFWCDVRLCGILGDRGRSVPLASGLHSVIKVFQNLSEKWVSATKIVPKSLNDRPYVIRDHRNYSFFYLQAEDSMSCLAAFTAVTLLSPSPWALPEKRSFPRSMLRGATAPERVDTLGFAATQRGSTASWWCLLRSPYLVALCKQSRSC